MGSPSLLWLALPLALAGTFLNGLGALWQNSAVRADARSELVRLELISRLLRNRGWILGQLAVVMGSLLHFSALAFAPVTVIQPIGVLAVMVTAVAAARTRRTNLDAPSILSLIAVTLGIGGFTALAAANATVTKVSNTTALLIAVIVGGILLLLGLIGAFTRGVLRCVAFAAGGGVMFGFASVVVRLAVLSLHDDYADFPIGSLTAAVVSVPAAIWFIQQAHASGPPDVVVAALTLADPLIAVGIGYVALGEGARTYPPALLGEILCFALAALGIIALSKHGHATPILAAPTSPNPAKESP